MLHRCHGHSANGQDDIRRERDQFGRVPAGEVDIVRARADIHLHIAAVAPAQLLQDLLECGDTRLRLWIICATINQRAYPSYLLRLLRTSRERPSRG